MVLLIISDAVELSVLMGVGGCGWPSSSRIFLIITASCTFTNNPPTSASAAGAVILLRMLLTACSGLVGGDMVVDVCVVSYDITLPPPPTHTASSISH